MMNNSQHPPRSNCTLITSAMVPYYRAAIDMVHCLQIRHAAGLYASTKAAIAWTALNLFRFLPSSLPQPPPTTTTNNNDSNMSATSEDGVSADAPFLAQLIIGSSCVWRTSMGVVFLQKLAARGNTPGPSSIFLPNLKFV